MHRHVVNAARPGDAAFSDRIAVRNTSVRPLAIFHILIFQVFLSEFHFGGCYGLKSHDRP